MTNKAEKRHVSASFSKKSFQGNYYLHNCRNLQTQHGKDIDFVACMRSCRFLRRRSTFLYRSFSLELICADPKTSGSADFGARGLEPHSRTS